MDKKTIIITIFLSILAVFGLIIWINSIKRQVVNGLNAPLMSEQAQATITTSDFNVIARLGISSCNITYVFKINGVEYSGADTIGSGYSLSPGSIAGNTITIKYRPDNPTINQTTKSLFSFSILASAIVMTVALVGIFIVGPLSSRHRRLEIVLRALAIICLVAAIALLLQILFAV